MRFHEPEDLGGTASVSLSSGVYCPNPGGGFFVENAPLSDLPFLAQPLDFFAQPGQFRLLIAGETVVAFALIELGLFDPQADRLPRWFVLLGQLAGRAPSLDKSIICCRNSGE